MEMLSSWWGGKPTAKSPGGETTKQVEKSSEPQGGQVNDGGDVAEKNETQSNSSTDPAPADTATTAGSSACEAADSSAKSTTAVAESEASDENKQVDGATQEDRSGGGNEESMNKKATIGIGGMTKEDAAVAAEAALQSAYNFGSFLFKKVSDTATKTASIIQKTVEEQTIVGDFQKEQEKFVQEKHSKRQDAAVPPWVGYNEEEQMKEQILALSLDKRNFMRNPPAGVQFHFDYNSIHPVAMTTLQEDPNLKKMRFELVPKMVKEENFWRNYFYRVSLIKQSSQLTSLASKSGGERKGSGSASHSSDEGSSQKGDKTPPIDVKGAPSVPSEQLEMEPPDSPPGAEFISDAFNSELDEADLKKGMEQLGMDKKAEEEAAEEEVPEWEKELQQELQDYEVVADEPNEEWEREINQMLEDEVNIE